MLVLARSVDEIVDIGGQIVVKVLSIRDGKVRLGFQAPPEVAITRRELTQKDHGNGLSGRSPATDSAD